MTKRIFVSVSFLLFVALVCWFFVVPGEPILGDDVQVLLVNSPLHSQDYNHVIRAYVSVMEEEGIPFRVISPSSLLTQAPEKVVANNPVIILPDGAAQVLPDQLGLWVQDYMLNGGSVAVIYDAGTRTMRGAFREHSMFSFLTGVEYLQYSRLRDRAFTSGYIRFRDPESRDFFQITPGKIRKNMLLTGYAYGRLTYPMARVARLPALQEKEIRAYTVTEDGEELPGVVLRKYLNGHALYVNSPLGYLKAYSDDLPLRAILRTFLFRVVRIPHLLNTPNGIGGLVVNWHIDANLDWKSIPAMISDGYLRQTLKYSMHITAGDFRDRPGDGLGFDACGRGRMYVEDLLGFGVIGSHGGWGHNWFADKLMTGAFNEAQEAEYIAKNSECLQSITGYPIVEYSAPVGVHPQPMTTQVLEKLGFTSYYYTGDTGSAHNRTFLNGRMVSGKVIAFPIVPLGKAASFKEMVDAGVSEAGVEKWLLDLVDYVERNRTVRLIYSHPYDIPDYPQALKAFLDRAEAESLAGRITIQPMSHFAADLDRFLKTEFQFQRKENGLTITLTNPLGLKGTTIAVPRSGYTIDSGPGYTVEQDDDYLYLRILEPICEKTIHARVD